MRILSLGEVAFSAICPAILRMDAMTRGQSAISLQPCCIACRRISFDLQCISLCPCALTRLALLSSMKALGMTPQTGGTFHPVFYRANCVSPRCRGLLPGLPLSVIPSAGRIEGYTGIRRNWHASRMAGRAGSAGSSADCLGRLLFSTCRMNGWMPASSGLSEPGIPRAGKRKQERITAWAWPAER